MGARKVNRSAEKRHRQNLKARARNRIYRGMVRSVMKKVKSETNPEKALSLIPWAYSVIDKVCAKGVIHKNAAARYKSRLMKAIHNL